MKEWVLYAAIMTGLFLLLFRDSNIIGAIAGVLISGPLYLLLGAVLAKFGYTRKTMKELRSERAEAGSNSGSGSGKGSSDATSSGDGGATARRAPAPTKRTSGGTNRPTSKQKRR